MTADVERWAEALAVIKRYGEESPTFVAERMMALTDDAAGRARWRAIGQRIGVLLEAAAKDERH